MSEIPRQFSHLQIARFEIVLQSETETILPALFGSTLRGAFGHALKAISCCVQHQDCSRCFLSGVCNYTTIFEPTSNNKLKDIPRPFIFEPPVPPLTKEISENQTLKIRVPEKGKISNSCRLEFLLLLLKIYKKTIRFFGLIFIKQLFCGFGLENPLPRCFVCQNRS